MRQLAWAHDWHIREETYATALARLIDFHRALPLAQLWGTGATSSSDGQYYRAGGYGEALGDINARHGNEPGVAFYTHISDQFGPYYTKDIAATASETPHALDGLLYHQTGLQIEEHYTDTGGVTDHVFGLCPLFGFRFAPRIRDLKDRRLYLFASQDAPPILAPLVGGSIDQDHIAAHWDDVLRLGASIRAGTVTASAMLKKLSAYPRQNGLAVALRELGRIERTLFTLEWLKSMDLRRRATAGLNKGEARNALARAVFFYRLGEMRDRSFESQAYRASGLNLLVAAIILWNTIYLERAFAELRRQGRDVRPELAKHVAPLGWEHIGLTGDYVWSSANLPGRRIVSAAAAQGINARSLSCLFVLTSRTICALSCRHPKEGKTVGFLLRAKRDGAAAKAFFRRAFMRQGRLPQKITLDGCQASYRAVKEALGEHPEGNQCEIRSSKYLNNRIEQDHRSVKLRLAPMLGLKNFRQAATTIAGIELMHRIRKSQVQTRQASHQKQNRT